jgi:hypothetical protein
MGTLFSNRYADALAKTMLSFAAIHVLFLAFEAIRGNMDRLNVFTILDLDLLVPALGKGALNFAFSYVLALAIYALVYRYLTGTRGKRPPA